MSKNRNRQGQAQPAQDEGAFSDQAGNQVPAASGLDSPGMDGMPAQPAPAALPPLSSHSLGAVLSHPRFVSGQDRWVRHPAAGALTVSVSDEGIRISRLLTATERGEGKERGTDAPIPVPPAAQAAPAAQVTGDGDSRTVFATLSPVALGSGVSPAALQAAIVALLCAAGLDAQTAEAAESAKAAAAKMDQRKIRKAHEPGLIGALLSLCDKARAVMANTLWGSPAPGVEAPAITLARAALSDGLVPSDSLRGAMDKAGKAAGKHAEAVAAMVALFPLPAPVVTVGEAQAAPSPEAVAASV